MSLDEAMQEHLDPIRADIARLLSITKETRANSAEILQILQLLIDDVDPIEDPNPDPIPPDPEPDPDPPQPPSASTTDLWLNMAFYRDTEPVLEYKNGVYRFDERAVALYSKYSGIRVMNWCSLLNKDVNWTWESRVQPTDLKHLAWDDKGLPIEALIDLANACNCDIWYNLPVQCDERFALEAGKLFRQRLNPNLRVVVEVANEVWQSNRGWAYPSGFTEAMAAHAAHYNKVMPEFTKGFNDGSRLSRVLGGQLDNLGVLKSHLVRKVNLDYVDAITVSGYFGNSPTTWKDALNNSTSEGLEAHGRLAEGLEKSLFIYELNHHIDRNVVDLDLANSPEVTEGVRKSIEMSKVAGASIIALYRGPGNRYPTAPWNFYDSQYRAERPARDLDLPDIGE